LELFLYLPWHQTQLSGFFRYKFGLQGISEQEPHPSPGPIDEMELIRAGGSTEEN